MIRVLFVCLGNICRSPMAEFIFKDMVKNYDETKAKRMLMSLIVPFGYYQPYVWESSNVMPPESF